MCRKYFNRVSYLRLVGVFGCFWVFLVFLVFLVVILGICWISLRMFLVDPLD